MRWHRTPPRLTQEMFNLTVETAHTFYVEQDGWLVHNINCGDLASTLQKVLLQRAGFSGKGIPILIDENLQGIRGSSELIQSLKSKGYDIRTVGEVLGNGTTNEDILKFAQSAGVRVLTRDRGRQLDGGFGNLAIQVDSRVKSTDGMARIIENALKGNK